MSSDQTSSDQRSLSDYLAILRRRAWVIIPAVALAGGLAFAYSQHQHKVYRASAEILLSHQTVSSLVTGVQSQDVLADPVRYAQTQAELAQSPKVAQDAITGAGVRGHTAAELLQNSHVTPSVNADLLRFTVDDPNREVAVRLAQTYAEAFTRYRISLNTAQLAEAYKELRARIAQLSKAGQSATPLYRQLEANAQQLRTLELLQTPDVVVKPATHANQIAPRPVRAGLLAAGIGLLFGLALGFLWDALDKRVRSVSEVEETLGLPVLSRVPAPAPVPVSELSMIHDSENAHADAIRRIRTNLEFANLDLRARMIMITSAVKEEGKSTTAADLAVAFAQAGRDVTLVDLDLRKPTLTTLFSLPPGLGLTDVVIGRTDLDHALVTVPIPTADSISKGHGDSVGTLRLLRAGALPASPGQFIGTDALARVLKQLREEHSLVLLDTPPLLAVGDAASLSAHIDGIVVIARLDRITRGVLSRLANELQSNGAPKLGVVITGVNVRSAYEYGYHRGKHRLQKLGMATQWPSVSTSPRTAERRSHDDQSNGSGRVDVPPESKAARQAESVAPARRRRAGSPPGG